MTTPFFEWSNFSQKFGDGCFTRGSEQHHDENCGGGEPKRKPNKIGS
jgi:hypothetical protein